MSQIEADRQIVDQNVSDPELKPKTIIPDQNIRHQNDDSFDSDSGQEIVVEQGSAVLEETEIVRTLICPLCLKVLYLNTQTSSEKECWESHFKFVCDSQKDEKAKQEIKKFCSVFNCKSQLIGVNKHKCTGCELEYCLRHRAHERHPCTSEEYVEIIDSEERKQEIMNFFNPPKVKKGTETSEKKTEETKKIHKEEEEEKKVEEIPKENEEIVKKRIVKEKESPVEEKKKASKAVTTTKKMKKQPDEALYKKVKQGGLLETVKSEFIEPYMKFKYRSELTLLIGIMLVFIIIENAS